MKVLSTKYFFGKLEDLMEVTFLLEKYIIIYNINDFSQIETKLQILVSNEYQEEWKDLELVFFITNNPQKVYFIEVNQIWLKTLFQSIYKCKPKNFSQHESIWSQFYKYSLINNNLNYNFHEEKDFVSEIFQIINKDKQMSRLWYSFLITGDENLIYYYACLKNY